MLLRKRSGQSMTEYAITFAVVAAAIVGIQLYLKRGIQAKNFDATNVMTKVTGTIGGNTMQATSQYEPYYADSKYSVAQDSVGHEEVKEGYTVDKTGITETTTRTGQTESKTDLGADDGWN